MKIDLHVHTSFSLDSIIRPEDLAKKSARLGIIPAITDHNSTAAFPVFRKLGLPFIAGEEIRTDRGDLTALFINEPFPKNIAFGEALDLIKEQGAISYLPHMYDATRHGVVPSSEEIPKIDIIEVFNSRCLGSGCNKKARQFAERHSKLQAVGSDSHFLFEFGSTYNELPDFGTPKEFLKSLEKAVFTTKAAPFYVRGTTSLVKFGKKFLRAKHI